MADGVPDPKPTWIARQDLGIGTILVIVPVAHVVLAAVHLYGYCFGFGAAIVNLVSPDDIFRTSVSSLITMYASGFLVFVIGMRRKRRDRSPSSNQKIEDWSFNSIPIVAGLAIAMHWLLGEPRVPMVPILFVVIPLWAKWVGGAAARQNWDRTAFTLYYAAPLVLMIALIVGIDSGSTDRHRTRAEASGRIMCSGSPVLRQVSDLYLAYGSGDEKVLMRSDCSIALVVPALPPRTPSPISRAAARIGLHLPDGT